MQNVQWNAAHNQQSPQPLYTISQAIVHYRIKVSHTKSVVKYGRQFGGNHTLMND